MPHAPFAARPAALRLAAALAFGVALLAPGAPPAHAGPGDISPDSVYLVGEFVDPVCLFQHGMTGEAQRQCARVRGAVGQGMHFLDIRQRRLYTVIGQNHWQDPRQGFLDALGDTFAIRARIWKRYGESAIVVNAMYPWQQQPPALYRAWPVHWEWSVLLGCGLIALAYGLAVGPLRRRLGGPESGPERWRVIVFLLGLLVVIGSLDGPVHDLSDLYFFTTHMVQHLLLAQVVPPLLILGVPPWLRRRLLAPSPVGRAWAFLAGVPMGFLLYTIVFTMWHVPPLYDLMMRQHGFHIVMHLMVMATATMLWWPIVGGDAVERPIAAPAQMLYLFLLATPMMAVAAMLVFAQRPLYEWYALAPRLSSLSPVEDQRLGALIMWIPGGLFWWGIMSVVYFRWSARERRQEQDPLIRPVARA
jgi:putative membrane protein